MSGRHVTRPASPMRRRTVRTPLIVLGALSLIGMSFIILRAVTADAEGCSSSGIRLTVAADPSVAAAVREIGARWSGTGPTVSGDCIRVEVVEKPSYAIAAALAANAGGTIDIAGKSDATQQEVPIAWIPDSSYWIGRMREIKREMFEAQTPSIAVSPIVMAMPEALSRALGARPGGYDAPALRALLRSDKAPKLGLVEPRRDTSGMIGSATLAEAIVESEANLSELVDAYRGISRVTADVEGLWQAFARGEVQAAPVSEQALLAHNATSKALPLAALAMADVPTLDYPYAIVTGQPRNATTAAGMFREALTQAENQKVFAGMGLRTADGVAVTGFPTGHGITTVTVHAKPMTDATRIRSALTVWVAARTPSRVVALVDATSSMSKTMPGSSRTRMSVMRDAATFGLDLFSNDSQLALWGFVGKGAFPMVPMGPLNKAQRDRLTKKVDESRPGPVDACPLYASILSAYQELLKNYDPAMSNTLVVFTDGSNNTGGDLRAVKRDLERLADVTRPIRVVLLGLGPDVNMDELKAIADTTGGVSVQVNNPAQIKPIFLKALLA